MIWTSSDTIAVVAIGANVLQFAVAEAGRRRQSARDKEEALRAEAAAVATLAAGLIWDSYPPAIRDAQERVPEIRSKWVAVRDRLLAVSVTYPNPEVQTSAKHLANGIQDTVEALEEIFLEPLKSSEYEIKQERLLEAHTRALEAQNSILNA